VPVEASIPERLRCGGTALQLDPNGLRPGCVGTENREHQRWRRLLVPELGIGLLERFVLRSRAHLQCDVPELFDAMSRDFLHVGRGLQLDLWLAHEAR